MYLWSLKGCSGQSSVAKTQCPLIARAVCIEALCVEMELKASVAPDLMCVHVTEKIPKIIIRLKEQKIHNLLSPKARSCSLLSYSELNVLNLNLNIFPNFTF